MTVSLITGQFTLIFKTAAQDWFWKADSVGVYIWIMEREHNILHPFSNKTF